MMVSFLAALTGGVSFEDETRRRSGTATEREREASAKIRIPSLISLLGFDASGRMGRRDQDEAGEEIRAVRQHTAASLFNALYETLRDQNVLQRILSTEDLSKLGPGDVVEVTGEFVGNPLQEILGFFAQAIPYFAIGQSGEELQKAAQVDVAAVQAQVNALIEEAQKLKNEAAEAKRSGNPARRAEVADLDQRAAGMEAQAKEATDAAMQALGPLLQLQQQQGGIRMLEQMRNDLATAAVHDTVIKGPGLQAVLTMSAEFFTDSTSAYLRAGIFTAVGKVTRVLGAEDKINLLRRTVLGAAGPEFGRQLIENATTEELKIETFDPIIEAPAVQILPLAVYI